MKILHTADWHLDAPFTGASVQQREFLRRELRRLPGKIVQIARNEGCDLILIAGDVFDGAYTAESLQALRAALSGCEIPVFITPGNHDYCVPGSPWLDQTWPENVHIFTGALESVALPELDCRIYGAGYQSMDCPGLLEGFSAVGEEKYQIGVLHGDPGAATSPYCPITTAQVRASGLQYLALGHIHKAGQFTAGDTLCAWPGCPMGRGFDETGEKGVYIVQVDENVKLRFLPVDMPRFYDLEVSSEGDEMAALEAVLPAVDTKDVYRVTLNGSGEKPLRELYEAYPHIPNLILTDSREAPVDIWTSAGEDTLEGVYFTMLRELTVSEDPKLRQSALLAAEISRKLLDGKEVKL